MSRQRIIEVMQMVADDVERDVYEFEKKPFDGRTMGEYMGNQAAAIKAIAIAVKRLAEEEPNEKST